jgi:hypothetical protein
MVSIGTSSLDSAGAPDDVFVLRVGAVVCEERSLWKEVGARGLRAPPARSFARAWRKQLAPVRSCRTPWTSADNAEVFTQSQLASALLAGAISPPNLFHPWRRGHRRTRLRCRHPRRPRTRQRRPASQSCGSSSQLGHQRPSRSRPIRPGKSRILRHSSSAATHRQQSAPDAVPSRRQSVLVEAEHLGSRALRQSSSAATRRR